MPLPGQMPTDWGDSKMLPLAAPALPSALLILGVVWERGRQATRLVPLCCTAPSVLTNLGQSLTVWTKVLLTPVYSVMPSDIHFHLKLSTKVKESSRSLGHPLCKNYPKWDYKNIYKFVEKMEWRKHKKKHLYLIFLFRNYVLKFPHGSAAD